MIYWELLTAIGFAVTRAVDFPKDFRSREREFPEISSGIPENSRELKTYYIKSQKLPIIERKCICLTNYTDFQLGYYLFRQ